MNHGFGRREPVLSATILVGFRSWIPSTSSIRLWSERVACRPICISSRQRRSYGDTRARRTERISPNLLGCVAAAREAIAATRKQDVNLQDIYRHLDPRPWA